MKKLLILLILGLFILSCTKEKEYDYPEIEAVNNESQKPASYFSSGLGTHQGIPAGTVFVLPEGLKIISDIQGGYPSFLSYQPTLNKEKMQMDDQYNQTKSVFMQLGVGSFVTVNFQLINTTNSAIDLHLPGGLILPYAHHNSNYQSGFLVQDADTTIIAGDTVDVVLKSFCLNRSYHPADSSARYMLGIVTTHPELLQVVSILQNKQSVAGRESDIQSILWHITDDGGLQPADTVLLNSLP